MMKRILYIVTILCCVAMSGKAEDKWAYLNARNEVRIGWGDQLFESLMWHNPTNIITTMPTNWSNTYHENYRHYQHLWAEYQWRAKSWFNIGAMADFSMVQWDDITRNGKGIETARSKNHNFYNIVIMPTIRFTYYHHPYVNLYSGLGIGMCINSGTETNGKGNKTDIGAAVNFTVFGISANYNRLFWTVDFGGMTALRDFNTIFMLSSRMINVSMGVRF